MPCPREQRGWVKTKALPSSPGLPRRSAAEGTKEEPLAEARRLVRRSVISRAPGEVMLGWERRGCFLKNYYYFFIFIFQFVVSPLPSPFAIRLVQEPEQSNYKQEESTPAAVRVISRTRTEL